MRREVFLVGGKQGVAIPALSRKIEKVVADGVRRSVRPYQGLRLLPTIAGDQDDQAGCPHVFNTETQCAADIFVEPFHIAALRPDLRGDVPVVLFCVTIRSDTVANRVAKLRQPVFGKVEAVPFEDRAEDDPVPALVVEFQEKLNDFPLVRDERRRLVPEAGGDVAVPEHGLEGSVRIVDGFQHVAAFEDEVAKAFEAAFRIGDLLQGPRRVAQVSGNLGCGDPAAAGAGRVAETVPEFVFGDCGRVHGEVKPKSEAFARTAGGATRTRWRGRLCGNCAHLVQGLNIIQQSGLGSPSPKENAIAAQMT